MNIINTIGSTSNVLVTNCELEFFLKEILIKFSGGTLAYNCIFSKFSINASGLASFNLCLPLSE